MSQFDKTITLLDSNFEIYSDPIKSFEELEYSDAWEKHGSMLLVVGQDEFASIKDAAWIEVDGRVYENETQESSDKDATVSVIGASLNVLFDRIVITEDERLQGRLEERVRYLVNKYAITGTQAVAGLTLGTDNNYARAMDATVKRGQTLSEFLYTAMNQRGFSFAIALVAGALVFNVLLGLNRTQDQSVNIPVTISTTGALENATYKKTIQDWRNFAVVCDEDPDAPQTVEVDLTNGEPVRAMYVSGRSAGADDSDAPNMFVMVGEAGGIFTSTNGVAWTERTSGTANALWSVDYTNGKFIAGGSTGDLCTSVDGTTWSFLESGSSYAIEGVTYYDGIYFAMTSAGGIGYSYDAITWTSALTVSMGGKIVNSVFPSDKFILYANGTSKITKGYSYDGVDWSRYEITVTGATNGAVIARTIYSKGLLVAAGYWYDGTTYKPLTIVSDDRGETETVYINEALSGHRFLDMAAGLGLFVAVGQPDIIAWSEDGITWTECTPGTSIDYIAITFNPDNKTFYAYGNTTRKVATSTDGKNWTVQSTTGIVHDTDAVVYGTSSHSGDLYQIGVDALQEAAIIETLDGDVNQDLAPVYETDYNVGDMIDAVDPTRGLMTPKRVLQVDHVNDKNNDNAVIPKLGKDFLSLRQFITKEIRNNGV